MSRAIEWFMSFAAIPTFSVISPQARMTPRILNLIKMVREMMIQAMDLLEMTMVLLITRDNMDDPNDEDVEMENQQQDQESSFGS